jgi:2-iminobutanoate/2-iminopropanoate deaminase
MMRYLRPEGGPKAGGGYTPGIAAGGFIFVSGQAPVDPLSGEVLGSTLAEQTRYTLENVARVLGEGGAGMADVVRVDAYLTDLDEFDAYDRVYREVFGDHLPARTTIETQLHGILVEINALAYLGDRDGA